MDLKEDEFENLCCPVIIENINVNDAPLLKDYYWRSLNIDQFNKEILTVKELDEPKIRMSLPDMHKNDNSFTIIFHVKNLTEKIELCWNIKRKKNCNCKKILKKINFNLFKNVYDCEHRQIVSINLKNCSIKGNSTGILMMNVVYKMIGKHELMFILSINNIAIEITISINIYEFNLPTFFLSNELWPVDISDVYPPIQHIWLLNSLPENVSLSFSCINNNLKIITNNITMYTNKIMPLLVQFKPDEVMDYEFQIQIQYNEEFIDKITISAKGVLKANVLPINLSPISDINCIESPITIYPNYVSAYIKQASYIEKIFIINNNTDFCVRFNVLRKTLENYYDIIANPDCCLLKAKRTKLILLSISSEGPNGFFKNVEIECIFYKYDMKHHKQVKSTEGYFEYTEHGYYANPPEEIKARGEYYTTVKINVNINIISAFNIDKEVTINEQLEMNPSRECPCQINKQINNNHIDRNFIDKILWKTVFNDKFEYFIKNKKKVQPSYNKIVQYMHDGNILVDKPDKLAIIALLDKVLKDSITEISKNYRFIPLFD